MSLRIHTGDICVINSERDSMKEYNGVVCQVASYYPAEIDESKISNLHDVIVLGPAFGRTNHTINTLRVHPDELFKIDLVKSCMKFVRTDLDPPDHIASQQNDSDGDKITIDFLKKYISEGSLRQMSEDICRERLTKVIDDAIDRSGKHFTKSYFDKVLDAIAGAYVTKFEDKYDKILLERFERIISVDSSETGEYDTFFKSAKSYLEIFTRNYIESHPDEIRSIVWDKINESARAISRYSIDDLIRKSINIEGLIQKIMEQTSESTDNV